MDTAETPPQVYNSPLDAVLGTRVVEGTSDRVVALLDVADKHFQPSGIVHGGVYACLVETTASIGASLAADCVVVGVSNSTEFIRAVRGGTLRAEAVPVHRGRSLQLWHVEIRDETQRLVAEGKVRLMNLRDKERS